MAWVAATVHGQIAPGTEFGIFLEGWEEGESPTPPPAETSLTVKFANGDTARVVLAAISDDEATIQMSDGAKWQMRRVAESQLLYQPAVPSTSAATFWVVNERVHEA